MSPIQLQRLQYSCVVPYRNAGADEPVSARLPKLSINIKEALSRAHWNLEEQNKVLESSAIIINYYIIINA
jgi:hypothetical protein